MEKIELYTGAQAGAKAGYEIRQSFIKAAKSYPIPDQGYRVNGKPAWTEEHLAAWRATVPRTGEWKRK